MLHRTNSRVSITSFAGSIDTKKAYKEFCQSLYRCGVKKEELRQKTREVMKVFGAQNSIQMDDSIIEDHPVEDDREENILHTAAYGGHEDTVQPLHTRGDSIKATDKDIESSLHTTPLNTTPLNTTPLNTTP